MAGLDDTTAALGRAFSQLSARERNLVAFAGVAFVIFVSSIAYTSLASAIGRREASIEEKGGMLQQVQAYARTYQEAEANRRQMELRLGTDTVALSGHVQNVAAAAKVVSPTIADLGEKQLEGVREALVEIRLPKVGLNELNDLLNQLEKSPRIVRVRKVRMRRDNTDPKALNVTVVVGAYWLTKQG